MANPTFANNGITGPNSWNISWGHTNPYTLFLPNKTGSGNAIIVGVEWGATSGTATVTDDKSNTYSLVKNTTSSGNSTLGIYMAVNVASGAQKITITLSADQTFVACGAWEFYNVVTTSVAAATDVTTANSVNATSITAGSFTPGTANDLLFMLVDNDNPGYVGTGSPVTLGTYSAGSQSNITWQLISANPMEGFAAQYGIYTTSGVAINPTMSQSVSGTANAVCVAIKGATAGTAPPAGIRVNNIQLVGLGTNTVTSPAKVQMPSSGNLLVMASICTPSDTVSSISDGTNTYVQAGSTQSLGSSGNVQIFRAEGATPAASLVMSLTLSGSTQNSTFMAADVSGAASSSVLDTTAATQNNQTTSGNVTSAPSYTPGQQNEAIFALIGVETNTITGSTNAAFIGPGIIGSTGFGQEDNGWALLYNGASTSAQAFGWTTSGGAVAHWAAQAAGFKSPAAAGQGFEDDSFNPSTLALLVTQPESIISVW